MIKPLKVFVRVEPSKMPREGAEYVAWCAVNRSRMQSPVEAILMATGSTELDAMQEIRERASLHFDGPIYFKYMKPQINWRQFLKRLFAMLIPSLLTQQINKHER